VAEVTFEPRYALPRMRNPDLELLRDIILDPSGTGREFGDAVTSFEDGGNRSTLILLSHDELGYYLRYSDSEEDEWLSLGNANRLAEVVMPDDWEASAGLFVAVERAWPAIEDFCQFGIRSEKIEWVRPADMPEGGNW
jgi:hypothetical protein